MSRILGGVGGTISCAHRDRDTGVMHGHTWEVTAWFVGVGDAKQRLKDLREVLVGLDHTTLPDELAWGEQIAQYVAERLGWPCCRVDVNRPSEKIYSRYEQGRLPRDTSTKTPWTKAETIRATVLRSLNYTYREIALDLKNGRTAKAVKRKLQSIGL